MRGLTVCILVMLFYPIAVYLDFNDQSELELTLLLLLWTTSIVSILYNLPRSSQINQWTHAQCLCFFWRKSWIVWNREYIFYQNFRRIRQEINELEKYAMNLNARKLNLSKGKWILVCNRIFVMWFSVIH